MRTPVPPVVVVGPTASGKSGLAVALAHTLDAEIVNTDSVSLYRGMDIGSAKPTSAERDGVPHHLIDVLNVTQEASVAEFQKLARDVIADIGSRGRRPILVGGSTLYLRAVIDPLEFPGTDPRVRARWTAELDRRGPADLHAELARRDPTAAAEILPTNGRRIVRALEVVELTGSFRATLPPFESVYPGIVMIGIDIPRDVLDARIEARVERMWADGFVDEVRELVAMGLAQGPTASRALGYQQILAMLDGDLTEAEAKELTIVGTRKFARRQDRMLRKDPRIHWLAAPPELTDAVRIVSAH